MSAKRVLIVEDDPIESLGLDDMMKHLGYEVTAIAISGEAAIGMAAQDRPDLVLMDILLAGRVNGIEAARKIRDTQHVPIIFVSACGTKPQGGSAEINPPEGFGYVVKPYTEDELAAAVEKAIGWSGGEDAN